MAVLRLVVAVLVAPLGLVLALPVLLLGAPFWIVGGLSRALVPLFRPETRGWPDLIRFHPSLGWKPKPGLDVYCLEERADAFRVQTDVHGWHGARGVDESAVIVLGDSNAFGYGIDAERSFAHVDPALPVKAIGAPGYNMVQELLLLRELAPHLGGKLVVWFVYTGNDLYDNLAPEMSGYRTPFVRQGDGRWEIVAGHIRPERWRASTGRAGRHHLPALAALHAPTALAARAYGACRYLVGEGASVCRAADARLVVMLLPSPLVLDTAGRDLLRARSADPAALVPDYPDRRLAAICAEVGVRFVALTPRVDRRDYLEGDDHWTARGHAKVARLLAELHAEGGSALLPNLPPVEGAGEARARHGVALGTEAVSGGRAR
jgi:hypothetical protein